MTLKELMDEESKLWSSSEDTFEEVLTRVIQLVVRDVLNRIIDIDSIWTDKNIKQLEPIAKDYELVNGEDGRD